MLQQQSWFLSLLILVTSVSTLPAQGIFGRPRIVPDGGDDSRTAAMVHVSDRRLTQRLVRARELIKQKEPQAAIGLLQSLLDHQEDGFFQDVSAEGLPFVSLKQTASRLLGTLDSVGRRAYELEYGTTARKLLERGQAEGGVELLEQAARRYFHTRAGAEATYALGNLFLDRGQSLAAAMQFERLRRSSVAAGRWEPILSLKTSLAWARSGRKQRAQNILLELPATTRARAIRLGGQVADILGSNEAARTWLEQVSAATMDEQFSVDGVWNLWRGNRSRTASVAGVDPQPRPEWVFPTFQRELDEPRRQGRLKTIRDQLQRVTFKQRTGDPLRLPAVDPLVIGDIAVFRSLFDVKAVHLPSGRHLWDMSELNPTFDRILDGNLPQRSQGFNSSGTTIASLTSLFLSQRAWQDRTVGTLSTDGRFVFAIDEVGVIGSQLSAIRRTGTSGAGEWVPREYNRLVAIELASEGKLAWELGGPRGERQLALGGTFFLGPPLPLGGQLLCLGERDGEIRLWSLVGSSGKVRVAWSQGIAEPEFNILLHPDRRLSGLSPSYADGVLICPTEAGLVVAVDLVRRQLLWSYAYRSRESRHTTSRQQAMQLRLRMARGLTQPAGATPGWFDPLPLISEGCVIITPRDSEELHCLNLEDGRQLWSQPRGDGSFVAAVHAGRVIVVGRSQVEAFRLADGESAWQAPVRIPRPTGVGVRSGSRYHLPVVTGTDQHERGAILTLDLVNGRQLARTEIDSGRPLGNLVNGGGRLLALSPDELAGFYPDDVLRKEVSLRLGRDTDDARALAIRGRQRLHRGKFDEGLNDLLSSWSRRQDPAIRRLLVQALLDGLRFDFGRYHERAGSLQNLFETPGEQLAFRRLQAEGLASTGRLVAAFNEYLALAVPDGMTNGDTPLEPINQELTVRRDRWVRARVTALYRSSDDSQRSMLDTRLAELFAKVQAGDAGSKKLERLVRLFAGRPAALQGARQLLERLPAQGPPLQRESLLLQLRGAADLQLAGEATVGLVELWKQRGRLEAAREYVRELRERFASVDVRKGRNGKQLVRDWQDDPEFSQLVSAPSTWKRGHVQVVATVNEERLTDVNTSSVPFSGPCPAAWRGWTFRLDPRKTSLMAIDPRGHERWRMTTVGDLAVPGSANRVPTRIEANYVQAAGHLLLIAMGNRFAVVDALHGTGKPRVLWTRNLYEDSSGVHPRSVGLGRPRGLGPQQVRLTDPSGRPMGHVGPLMVGRLTYQVGSTLFAADPLNGKTLWSRRQVARGSQLYGTSGYVFVEDTERGKVLVLSGDDGALLATRQLPEEASVVVRSGQHLVYALNGVGDQQIHSLDLVSGKTSWKFEIEGEFLPVEAGPGAVALFDMDRRFQVLDVASGKPRVDLKLPGIGPTDSFNVFVTPTRYIVMVNRPLRDTVRGISNRALVVNGQVWGIPRMRWREKRTDGKEPVTVATWGPLTIERQAIEPGQQRHLPVLVFVSRVYRRVQNNLLPRPRTEYSMMVLDQRNGQLVHKNSSTLSISTMRPRANPDLQQIKLQFMRTTLELTFSDQPRPKPEARPSGT